ncbi:MAG TPA: hypothetical protein PLC98_19210 [Anaerolineales bacterium]|nr:hypothetical protein [Anaerolineales bacterium]
MPIRVTEPTLIDEPPTDGPEGSAGPEIPDVPTAKRNSIFPFLVDLGAVVALFGLFIGQVLWGGLVGWGMMAGGGTLAVVGLIGWFVEARADYRRMPD